MDRTLAGGRFLVNVDPIASGEMGLVYQGYDHQRDCRIAIKRLIQRSPEQLYRLKQEFRSLSRTIHSNLLEFFDLIDPAVLEQPSTDDTEFGPFISMELVEGINLFDYVRDKGGADQQGRLTDTGLARLDECTRQVIAGIEYLHQCGRIHRDIKPENLLVDESGRLVIIDFGLSLDFKDPTKLTSIGGSPSYMSPEQLRGDTLTPASDWYGVGISLYEVICGQCPYSINLSENRDLDITQDILKNSDVSPQIASLVAKLLLPDAAERASAADVRQAFEIQLPAPVATPSTVGGFEAPFVGREAELSLLQETLRTVLRGHCTVSGIAGDSGIGKSALLAQVLRGDLASSFIILTGRCHQQELVPFKALDGVVDAISNVILNLPPSQRSTVNELPRAAMLRLFPVLKRVFPEDPTAEIFALAEPREVRDAGFTQLIGLLAVVAQFKPLVIWIDDLQWGDLDSAPFLIKLAASGLRIALLLSFRLEEEERPSLLQVLLDANLFSDPNQLIRLTQLEAAVIGRLVASLLPDQGSRELEKSIVASSGGSPFFACEFARHAQHLDSAGSSTQKLAQLVEVRLQDLEDGSRDILELLALVRGPCSRRMIERASMQVGKTRSTSALVSARLVSSITAGPDEQLEICHDRIRSAVSDLIVNDRRRELYATLAESLEKEPDPDPLLAFDLYSGCGENTLAAAAAVKAARRAYQALAFDQAIRLYEESLKLDPDAPERWRTLGERALSYAQAGRSKEAGDSALSAARLLKSNTDMHTEYVAQITVACEQLLRGGYLNDGLATLELALRAVNLPYYRSPLQAVASFLYHRVARRLLRRPARVEIAVLPTRTQARIDVCWAAAAGLAWVYPMHSAAYQTNYLRLCLGAGEAQRLVRALCTESVFLAGIYGHDSARLSSSSMRDAKQICSGIDDVVAQGLIKVCETGTAFFSGKFNEAIPLGLDAERFLRSECTGVSWEITNVNLFAMVSLAHLGRFAELDQRLPEILTRASEQGNLLASCCLRTSYAQTLRLLAQDRPEAVRESIDAAYSDWRGKGFEILHYYVACSETRLLLYENRIEEAWERLAFTWRAFHWSQVAGFELVKAEIVYLRARCALEMLKLGLRKGEEDKLHKVIKRCLRRLKRAKVDIARAWLTTAELEYQTLRGHPPTQSRLDDAAALLRLDGFDLGADMLCLRINQLSAPDQQPADAGTGNASAMARFV